MFLLFSQERLKQYSHMCIESAGFCHIHRKDRSKSTILKHDKVTKYDQQVEVEPDVFDFRKYWLAQTQTWVGDILL